ncbi:MAG: hypothetical protein EP347_10830 [Alphaproteobacteria bacterium]|nr:MAG: hypothetical protein EP347_10830 [Alphaproteobacteria bacterium]
MKYFALATLLLSTALGGCIGHNEPLNATFGEAHRNNMAAQIIDPTPSEEDVVADGNNAAAATERYQTDSVKEPKAPRSSSLSSGGN